METPEIKKKKRAAAGWITAVGVHAIIAVLLLIFGFTTPLPIPEPEGISVDLGFPDAGGPDNAASMTSTSAASSSENQQSPDVTEDSDNAALPENQNTNSQSNDDNSSNSPIRTPEKKIDDELANRLKTLADNAGKGEGDGKEPGDDGEPDGTEGADKGGGIGFGDAAGLGSGRYLEKTPVIKEQKQQTGFIEVEVLVNKMGKVIDARVNLKSGSATTITDTRLHAKVVRAVKEQAEYTPTISGPDIQKAKYIFEFKLN